MKAEKIIFLSKKKKKKLFDVSMSTAERVP